MHVRLLRSPGELSLPWAACSVRRRVSYQARSAAQSDLQNASSSPCRLLRVRGLRLAPTQVSRPGPLCSLESLATASSRSGPGCLCRSVHRKVSSDSVETYVRVWRDSDAHLEPVEDAIAAKQLALAGVLGRPGKHFVTGARHDRRGMSSVGKLRR